MLSPSDVKWAISDLLPGWINEWGITLSDEDFFQKALTLNTINNLATSFVIGETCSERTDEFESRIIHLILHSISETEDWSNQSANRPLSAYLGLAVEISIRLLYSDVDEEADL